MLCVCDKRSIAITLQILLLSCLAFNGLSSKAQNRDALADSINTLKSREQIFEGNEKLVMLNNSHIATIYDYWARKEANLGCYQYAADLYEEGLRLHPLNDNSIFLLKVNYCELCLRRGMYSQARRLLDELQPTTSSQWFVYFSDLSSYYLYVNELDSARVTLQRLDTLAETAEQKSNVVANWSYLLMQTGDYADALEILKQELRQTKNNRRRYILLSHKAVIESQLNRHDAALEDIESCLRWQRDNLGEQHQDYIIGLRKKGEILQRMGTFSEAAVAYRQYISLEKEHAMRLFPIFTEQQRLDYWKNKKPLISEPFSLDYTRDQHYTDFLYDVALFRRHVALLGKNDSVNIANKLSITKSAVARVLARNEVAIEFIKYEKNGRYRYAALLLNGSDKNRDTKFIPLWTEDSINNFNLLGVRLDAALCSRSAADKNQVYENTALSSFVWDKLLACIPQGSTVYFAPDGILHLLAIEYLPTVRNGIYEFHRLSSTALLTEKNRTARKPNDGTNRTLVLGGMDYDIIPPAAGNGSVSHNRDAYTYLLQNNLPRHFSYLPGTKDEVDSIELYVSHADKFEDIDEYDIKCRMGNYNRVHLATHGYSWRIDVPNVPFAYRDSITEDKSLLASGIALSGANRLFERPEREDGLLSSRELCELNLTGVELVVASACQSAQGRVSDEGPIGLVRGLKKAGAKTIIASLWPVDDGATTLIMQYFYDQWREGNGKDGKGCSKTAALHMAQERLRETESGMRTIRTYNPSRKTGKYKTEATRYDAPYYWAPFIIIDDI